MRIHEFRKLLPLAALLAVAAISPAQVDPARTIATINGEAIKGSEYYRRMEFLPGVGKRDGDNFFEAPPGFLMLEQLITERLVMQLAKQKGVMPSDLEVDAELKTRQEDNPNLLAEWAANGRPAEELKQLIRYELAQFKLATFGITVTDAEVVEHYNTYPTMYTVPKQAKLRVIVVDTAAGKATVDKELAAGKSFSDVATAHSVDVSKTVGGDYGTVPFSFLNTAAKTAVEAVKIGQATEWVTSNTADNQQRFVKFMLVDVLPEKKLPLDAKLKRTIRRVVMNNRGAVKNDIRKEMNDMRLKAKVEITEPEFATIYKRFVEAYLKQK
jgi:hypothetical protein